MIKVGVVRGGVSPEYSVSLLTGGNVLSHLRGQKLSLKYKPIDILIDKDGVWHLNGLPIEPHELIHKVDVVFNALHGDYGEDGKIQQVFDQLAIPYTGSGAFASAVGYNKVSSKEKFLRSGIKTPKHMLFPVYNKDSDGDMVHYAKHCALHVARSMPPSWIVKPVASGSSVGIHVCKTTADLVHVFIEYAEKNIAPLVEELIHGKEATVAVVEGFRGQEYYSLPPIEIRIPKKKVFFDYDAKYTGMSEEICPGNFSPDEKIELEHLARLIHKSLGLSHYSRSDFIVHPKRGIYALEVNTLPGLTNESLTPKALYAVGAEMHEFIDHIIEMALRGR
jgi:D-alanine-D-alanine ligase